VQRELRFAVRRPLEDLFDDLALRAAPRAQRLAPGSVVLEGDGYFAAASGRRKIGYTSGKVNIWALDLAHLAVAERAIEEVVGEHRVRDEMFSIDWQFHSASQGLTSVTFEELADPELDDAAYPTIAGGVAGFIRRYLQSADTVLVLQGPPGTGKTRLVRAMLAALSRQKAQAASVLYTADKRTLETDQIYVEFLTGEHDAFVIEDADHLLGARANGNVDLHRFLTVADGVVRAQGRKIIFTTNLPNIGDIDPALIRPGRCFAVLHTRGLTREESRRWLEQRPGLVAAEIDAALASAFDGGARSATLAMLYRAITAQAPIAAPPGDQGPAPE
jgi:hypothetical protein